MKQASSLADSLSIAGAVVRVGVDLSIAGPVTALPHAKRQSHAIASGSANLPRVATYRHFPLRATGR